MIFASTLCSSVSLAALLSSILTLPLLWDTVEAVLYAKNQTVAKRINIRLVEVRLFLAWLGTQRVSRAELAEVVYIMSLELHLARANGRTV